MKKTNKPMITVFIVVVISCIIAGSVAELSAGDFDEDVANTSNILRDIADQNEKSKSNSALESYWESRTRALNALLDILRKPKEPDASNWSSQIGNGKSAVRSLEDKVSRISSVSFLRMKRKCGTTWKEPIFDLHKA